MAGGVQVSGVAVGGGPSNRLPCQFTGRYFRLPYERIADERKLIDSILLYEDEYVLVLQPFGWHLNGDHIPNCPEQAQRNEVCHRFGWEVVCDFGPYIAVVRPQPELRIPHDVSGLRSRP